MAGVQEHREVAFAQHLHDRVQAWVSRKVAVEEGVKLDAQEAAMVKVVLGLVDVAGQTGVHPHQAEHVRGTFHGRQRLRVVRVKDNGVVDSRLFHESQKAIPV
jgi:hypothetical protein